MGSKLSQAGLCQQTPESIAPGNKKYVGFGPVHLPILKQ